MTQKTKFSKYLETRYFMKTWKKSPKNRMTVQYFQKESNKKSNKFTAQRNLNCNLKGGRLFAAMRMCSWTGSGGRRWHSLHATSENFQLDRVVRSLSWFILKYGNFWGTLGVLGGCETGRRAEESFYAFPSWDGGGEKNPLKTTRSKFRWKAVEWWDVE